MQQGRISIAAAPLIDARSADGQRLFAIRLDHPDVAWEPTAWTGAGMARADTRTVILHEVPAIAVGGSGDYLQRPGFWAGAVGVAACWHGVPSAVAPAIPEEFFN